MLISTSHRTQESALKSSRGPHNNSGTITTTLTLSVFQVTSITNMWCDVETSWPQPSFNNLLFLCYCLCWGMIVSLVSQPTFSTIFSCSLAYRLRILPRASIKIKDLTHGIYKLTCCWSVSVSYLSLYLFSISSPPLSPYIVIKNIVLYCYG